MSYQQKRLNTLQTLFPAPVGKGLINNLINNLPFQAHVPGYNYLGPGTNLDLNLEKGVKPANKLDDLALTHDKAYSKSNILTDRHQADYALQEGAWNRVLAPDSSLGEKAAAWAVTNVMKAKRAIGAGVATRYKPYPISLSEEDKLRVANASKPIEVHINLTRTKSSLMNELDMPLTVYQINKIVKGRKEKKNSVKLKLSTAQLQHFKQGGFLPALLAAASVLGTLYNSYSNKKANDRLVEERIRHNKALEGGKGLYMSRKPRALEGTGLYMSRKPRALEGGSIRRKKGTGRAPEGGSIRRKKGIGLYMSRKPRALEGNGLLRELLKKKKTLR